MDETYQVVRRTDLKRLVEAMRLYLEQDECMCDTQPCREGCQLCMYCIAATALKPIGVAPVDLSELAETIAETEEWLSEFCDDPEDKGAQDLIATHRDLVRRLGMTPS